MSFAPAPWVMASPSAAVTVKSSAETSAQPMVRPLWRWEQCAVLEGELSGRMCAGWWVSLKTGANEVSQNAVFGEWTVGCPMSQLLAFESSRDGTPQLAAAPLLSAPPYFAGAAIAPCRFSSAIAAP